MIRFERINAHDSSNSWTPGLALGVFFYVVSVLALYWIGLESGRNHAPCALLQFTGIRCPLCGGTSACVSLATGHPVLALKHNPLVTLGVICFGILIILRLLLKIRITLTLSKPLLICSIIALVAINWAYVLTRSSQNNQLSPPVGRELLHRVLQR